jgi:hypothetical protein
MPAGSTYSTIATQTLGSNQATVTFSSIPGTYTDLVLITNGATTVANKDIYMRFNSDTGTNYSRTVLYGDGTSAASDRASNVSFGYADYLGWTGTTLGTQVCVINIMNYSNSTTNKTYLSRSNNASSATDLNVGMWRNTAAINRIDIGAASSGIWITGSTFTLYGISAA